MERYARNICDSVALESRIAIGDTVLIRQAKHNKFTTRYDPRAFKVIRMKGSMITAYRDGKYITRNINRLLSSSSLYGPLSSRESAWREHCRLAMLSLWSMASISWLGCRNTEVWHNINIKVTMTRGIEVKMAAQGLAVLKTLSLPSSNHSTPVI